MDPTRFLKWRQQRHVKNFTRRPLPTHPTSPPPQNTHTNPRTRTCTAASPLPSHSHPGLINTAWCPLLLQPLLPPPGPSATVAAQSAPGMLGTSRYRQRCMAARSSAGEWRSPAPAASPVAAAAVCMALSRAGGTGTAGGGAEGCAQGQGQGVGGGVGIGSGAVRCCSCCQAHALGIVRQLGCPDTQFNALHQAPLP